jgi:hypothetical protein
MSEPAERDSERVDLPAEGSAPRTPPDILVALDTNQDGKADIWVADTDGDGKADLYELDTDGDGEVDLRMVDVDQDGTPDKVVDS